MSARKEANIKKAEQLTTDLGHVRNINIAGHIDHGKTLVSERLMAGAGIVSDDAIDAKSKTKNHRKA